MKTNDPEQTGGASPVGHERAAAGKRPYRAPKLTVYGNLRKRALQTKGGAKNDGKNVPVSRT